MATGILFDLDGTLFDRDAAVRVLVREQHRCFGAPLTDVPEDAYVSRIAALVGDRPTQRMQFTSLCQENAKEHVRGFHNEGSAREWLQGPA